ncbi:MAG: ArsR family transcriptional regulator, partial [Nitrosopumilales archaeon]|nr:ArsR family transcriptional regulator [Nitrosopumilales archaeon]
KLIITKLETPRTPTFLAKELNFNLANISRALTELENKNIVVCLTPEQKVGKIYSLTKKGKDILSKTKKMEDT